MASGTKWRAVRHHNPFTVFFHAMRAKHGHDRGRRRKVTDFFDRVATARCSPAPEALAARLLSKTVKVFFHIFLIDLH